MATGIGRSRVGTYHKGHERAGAIQGGSYCNGRMHLTLASENDIKRANSGMFCEKCFPLGKPE